MRTVFAICVLVSGAISLKAQDSTATIESEPQTDQSETVVGPALSDWPTSQELADLLTSNEIDVRTAQARIAQKGENALEGLVQLLEYSYSPRVMTGPDTIISQPNRVFIVESIRRIGSESTWLTLISVAAEDPDIEARTAALLALATDYHSFVVESQLIPSISVVGSFITALQTDQYVGYLQRNSNAIAQEGLVQWLGLDFGDPQFKGNRLAAGGGEIEISGPAYAQLWWDQNADKLAWNATSRRFELDKTK